MPCLMIARIVMKACRRTAPLMDPRPWRTASLSEQVIEFEGTPHGDLIGIYNAVTLSESYILHHEAHIQEGLEDLAMPRGRLSSRKP